MKKRIALFIAVFAVLVSALGINLTYAEDRTEQFKMYYTEMTLPDNVVVVTGKTQDSSSDWTDIGILGVTNAKKDFENRNVVAAIGDKNTKSIVYFISMNSGEDSSLLDTFSILGWDDSKVLEYADSHSKFENAEVTSSVYHHAQGNFFKLNIQSEDMEEVIYGTILNGILVEFSMDNEIGGAGIDENFLRQIVDSIHFTRIYTRDEYDAAVSKTWRTVVGVFGGLVLIFIGLIVIHKINKNKAKKHADRISNSMFEFRQRQKAGEIQLGEPLYTVETVYDSNIMNEFVKYTTWKKNLVSHILCAIAYALILWYTYQNGNMILLIFTVAVAFVVLYMMYTSAEKKKDNLNRQFVVTQKKTAVFKFYDEYLTMSGISSLTEFIYVQITDARINNGYLFLYMSSEYALMLDLEGMEEEKAAALYGMVKEKIKIK